MYNKTLTTGSFLIIAIGLFKIATTIATTVPIGIYNTFFMINHKKESGATFIVPKLTNTLFLSILTYF